MTHILVLGASGLLGSSLCQRLTQTGHTVLRQGRGADAEVSMDPCDTAALAALLAQQRIDVIVNLIAATNVDQCEDDPQGAYRANVRVVESLARAIAAGGQPQRPHLVHISTDQVYDGAGPHLERLVDPCNVYGLSKLAGEFAAYPVGATVLRTNFIGRSRCAGRTSLTDWLVNSLRGGQAITVFDDVLFGALHIDTLCQAIELTIDQRIAGTFNLGCADGASKAALAFGVADRLGFSRNLLTVGRAQDAKFRGRRPLDMRMDSTRFAQSFGCTLPTFASQIDLVAQEYDHE